ncbi:MAG: hypothetical protein NTU67_02790 [Gemmatimonadetes bacterium]|nr:hypothetical protein [Gemmatimonadota bacterium]
MRDQVHALRRSHAHHVALDHLNDEMRKPQGPRGLNRGSLVRVFCKAKRNKGDNDAGGDATDVSERFPKAQRYRRLGLLQDEAQIPRTVLRVDSLNERMLQHAL